MLVRAGGMPVEKNAAGALVKHLINPGKVEVEPGKYPALGQ
jgi:hypothetical protein